MGLPHNGKNTNENYAFLLGIRVRSCISLEIQIPSLCDALATEITNEEKHRLRLQELEALDDKCLQAQGQIKIYQA